MENSCENYRQWYKIPAVEYLAWLIKQSLLWYFWRLLLSGNCGGVSYYDQKFNLELLNGILLHAKQCFSK